MAQWLRICLQCRGRQTDPWSGDPTCRGAAKPGAPPPLRPCSRAGMPRVLSLPAAAPEACTPRAVLSHQRSPRRGKALSQGEQPLSPQLEKGCARQWWPSRARNQQVIEKIIVTWVCSEGRQNAHLKTRHFSMRIALRSSTWGFAGGTSGEEPSGPCRRCRDTDSIPGSGRSPGGGPGDPL